MALEAEPVELVESGKTARDPERQRGATGLVQAAQPVGRSFLI